jgi:hypothetical protein
MPAKRRAGASVATNHRPSFDTPGHSAGVGACLRIRMAGLGRRDRGSDCLVRVGTASSSRAEAVADTANRLASGLRQLHLKQRPFVAAPVAGPSGRLVAVSVSRPAGSQGRQPLLSRPQSHSRVRAIRAQLRRYFDHSRNTTSSSTGSSWLRGTGGRGKETCEAPPQSIERLLLFAEASVADVGPPYAALDHVIETLVDHIAADAHAGHHRGRGAAQVVRCPSPARQDERGRGLAATSQPARRLALSITELLAKGLGSNRAREGGVGEQPGHRLRGVSRLGLAKSVELLEVRQCEGAEVDRVVSLVLGFRQCQVLRTRST